MCGRFCRLALRPIRQRHGLTASVDRGAVGYITNEYHELTNNTELWTM